jgi:hypothetical protein
MNKGFIDGNYAIIPYGRNYIILHQGEQIAFCKTIKDVKATLKSGTLTKPEKTGIVENESKRKNESKNSIRSSSRTS